MKMNNMETPIYDFIKKYSNENISRLHMPGHKGTGFLGCENMDITEILGADSLYEANGIIKESEKNATKIFKTGDTFYSTEGSSLCIRAMLYAALISTDKKPVILAARNVHKSFVYACAALDINAKWIYPKNSDSLCGGTVTAEEAEDAIKKHKPFALFITSPNYLGEITDIKSISAVCRKYNIPLLVDNAHGAYLKFINKHPIELGAAMCCDSAHKTLPVLTGGAYLHISNEYKNLYSPVVKNAMGFFGSTSPSYLTLASLDLCNKYIFDGYREKLNAFITKVNVIKESIENNGFELLGDEPLKITVRTNGIKMAEKMRSMGGECEYCDEQFIVFMLTPQNSDHDLELIKNLFENNLPQKSDFPPPLAQGEKVITIRNAILSPQENIMISQAIGRICASPTVSCPPAVPIAMSGEIITEEMVKIFEFHNIKYVSCVK